MLWTFKFLTSKSLFLQKLAKTLKNSLKKSRFPLKNAEEIRKTRVPVAELRATFAVAPLFFEAIGEIAAKAGERAGLRVRLRLRHDGGPRGFDAGKSQ